MKPPVTIAPTFQFTRARSRFVTLTDRLGKRLRVWERQLDAKDRVAYEEATARGEPFMVSLPPEEFLETFKAYARAAAVVLADQRDRERLLAAAKDKDPNVLSDAQYEEGIQQLALEGIQGMSDDQLERELAERRARRS